MNTGFLGPAVATVPTVYGIETVRCLRGYVNCYSWLQQYLPFTVLKQEKGSYILFNYIKLQQYLPFTVLKPFKTSLPDLLTFGLQQYLPFTVLKRKYITFTIIYI